MRCHVDCSEGQGRCCGLRLPQKLRWKWSQRQSIRAGFPARGLATGPARLNEQGPGGLRMVPGPRLPARLLLGTRAKCCLDSRCCAHRTLAQTHAPPHSGIWTGGAVASFFAPKCFIELVLFSSACLMLCTWRIPHAVGMAFGAVPQPALKARQAAFLPASVRRCLQYSESSSDFNN